MVNESKNMYIPEDTLENHQGMLSLAILFFLHLFSSKHLVTVHGSVEQGRGEEGGEAICKWGWDGGREGGGGGSLACASQQMDRCLSLLPLAPPHFFLFLRAAFSYI